MWLFLGPRLPLLVVSAASHREGEGDEKDSGPPPGGLGIVLGLHLTPSAKGGDVCGQGVRLGFAQAQVRHVARGHLRGRVEQPPGQGHFPVSLGRLSEVWADWRPLGPDRVAAVATLVGEELFALGDARFLLLGTEPAAADTHAQCQEPEEKNCRTEAVSDHRPDACRAVNLSASSAQTAGAGLVPITLSGGKTIAAWAVEDDFDPTAIRSNTCTREWPPNSGNTRAFPEVDRAGWFTIHEARGQITKGQHGFLD